MSSSSFTPEDDFETWLSASQETHFLSPPAADSSWTSYRRPHSNSFNSTLSSPPISPAAGSGISPAIGNLELSSFDSDLFAMDLDPVATPLSAGIKRRHTDEPPTSDSWMDDFFSTFPGSVGPPIKRRRSWQRCLCVCPDAPIPNQKLRLDKMPTEILLLIFEFAFLSPEIPPRCHHAPDLQEAGIMRRATLGSNLTPIPEDKKEQTEELRIFRAKTLLNIMLTCRLFNSILAEDHGTDESFWRSAARWCWEWLPEKLADVQGRNLASQTSWRNLVAVFMRCENGLFGKKGAGKGGAESFGGKKSGIQAKSWRERKRNGKIAMVIGQPGPDGFSVATDPQRRGWTVSMTLRGYPTAEYFVAIDEFGNFGTPIRTMEELRRNERSPGYWPQDIFAVDGDRTQMVRVDQPVLQEQISWDLAAIPEFVMDKKASVARCVSHDRLLICSLYTHGTRVLTGTELEQMLEPPEDPRIFCIEAITRPSCDISGVRRGKLPESGTPSSNLLWSKTFTHPDVASFTPDQHLHPVLCSLAVNSTYFVALVRWNTRTTASPETFSSRVFHVLSPRTGAELRVLDFPSLYWDYRHHDMSADYNLLRIQKLESLYNYIPPHDTIGAGNRATRVHDDRILITDKNTLISGSHDYCNWVWPLDKPPPKQKGNYSATANDAGKFDPFTVLDDFYWSAETSGQWTNTSERAGWWVRTPNQVLCFWHSFALSLSHRHFAASRPGKLFVWDLQKPDDVRAYEFEPGPKRWTGRLKKKELWSKIRNWFTWEEVLPRPGLWMVEEGGEVYWAEAEEVRREAGVREGWWFEAGDFEDVGGAGLEVGGEVKGMRVA